MVWNCEAFNPSDHVRYGTSFAIAKPYRFLDLTGSPTVCSKDLATDIVFCFLHQSKWVDVPRDATDTARTSPSPSLSTTGLYVIFLWIYGLRDAADEIEFIRFLTPRSESTIWVERRHLSMTSPSVATWSPTNTSRSLPKLWKLPEFVPTSTSSRPQERTPST